MPCETDSVKAAALDRLAGRPDVGAGRIVVQGRSWSGYWAARLAIAEKVLMPWILQQIRFEGSL